MSIPRIVVNASPTETPRKAMFTLDLDDFHSRMASEDTEEDSWSPPSSSLLDEKAEIVLKPNPGTLPPDVYDTMLGPWRAAVRRVLVRMVEKESAVLARMQGAIRTPLLDKYFVYTSSLGTHTFFMTALPAMFFFGYADMARGLIFVLAMGVYVSSFIKDLFCSPRPFAPPVTRLSVGTHHLEYGFPSTHSTNSVSIALLVLEYVAHFHLQGTLSTSAFAAWCIGLSWYLFSIVFGRLYTGMHSITDCAMGVFLGTGVWAIHYFAQDAIRHVVTTGDWAVPAATVLVGMILVHKHPQPIDDCPCFEDAIAFVSVVIGIVLGWWHGARAGWLAGAPAVLAVPPWIPWWVVGTLKLVGGVLAIFGWRLVAKAALHAALPPIFRLLARAVALPNRRFYTPATDYAHVPADGLRPIPSMIDLTSLGVEEEQDAHVTSASGIREGVVRRPNGKSARVASESGQVPEKQGLRMSGVDVKGEDVKHYDADVLTKVGVYSGIGLLASYGLPLAFDFLGWNSTYPSS